MANSLGTASLILTANNQQLSSVLGKTEKEVQSWSSRVGGFLKSSLKVAGGAAAAGLGAGLAAITAINPFERLQDLAKQGDIAMSLGITSEAFTSIAGVAKSAGSDTRDFLEGLITLSGKAMDAAAGRGEDAVRVFQQLGVNAQEFASLNPEQQFYKLFEALNKVENPAQRVNLLLKAVGEDTGKNMTSLLGKSTEELKKLGNEFKVSTEDMAKAQVASQQLTLAKAQLNKALDQVSIALAPVASMLADQLPKAIETAKQAFSDYGGPVLSVLKKVAQGVGFVLDVWEAAKSVVQFAISGWIMAFGTLIEKLGDLLALADKLPESMRIPGLSEAAKDMQNFGKNTFDAGEIVGTEAAENLMNFGKQQQEALKWFDGLMGEREKRIDQQAKKLQPGQFKPQEVQVKVEMVASALKGSQEATKITQAWAFQGKMKDDLAQQQLRKQMEANKILDAIKLSLAQPHFRFGIV
jgi:hypothetical protein